MSEEEEELPRHINHPFHPSHPLILGLPSASGYYTCDSCHRDYLFYADWYRKTDWYRCEQCDFYMDKDCALMEPITCQQNQQHILHFTHQHPLLLHIDSHHRTCFACQSRGSGDEPIIYGCQTCEYYLHKSCAELPHEIKHPLHTISGHSLSLLVAHKSFICKLCYTEHRRAFAFKCQQCSLWLCVKCGCGPRRTIEYKDHYKHPNLCFVERLSSATKLHQCGAYSAYCKQQVASNSEEFHRTRLSVFRCLECDFGVHLLCGPLPSTIKYKYHIHPLTLVDSVIGDDFNEFYCDVCETERDPRIRVYYCKPCNFIAHVHCLLSEIIKVVNGDVRDDVELKTVGQHLWKYSNDVAAAEEEQANSDMTLKDIINKLTWPENYILQRRYKWDDRISSHDESPKSSNSEAELGDEDIARILELSRFSDEHFKQLLLELRQIYKDKKWELKASDLEMKIVKVEQGGYTYMIPHSLAPVLTTLLHKYGDVSDPHDYYGSTQEWKSIMYFLLCKAVHSMCTTKVVDITRNHLREWFHHLRFVMLWSEFRINFACAHYELLSRAFLGAQAKRVEFEIPTKLEKQITQLHQVIAKKNGELKICKEYLGPSPKSDFMKECLKKASELKWKNESEDLFSRSQETTISHCWTH